jgi:hypothetical protein
MFGGKVNEGNQGLANGNYIFTVTEAVCGWNENTNDKGVKNTKLAMRFKFQDSEGGEAESKVLNLPFEESGFYRSAKSAFYPVLEAMLGRPIDFDNETITFAVEGCETLNDIPLLFEKGSRPPLVMSLKVGDVELMTAKKRIRLSVSDGDPYNGKPTKKHVYSADEFVTTPRKTAAPKPAAQAALPE